MTFETKATPLLGAPAQRLFGVKLLNRDGSARPAYQGRFVRSNPCPAPDGRDTPWAADIVEAGRKATEMNRYYDDKPHLAARPMCPIYVVAPIWSAPVVVEVL
jgi:hypothetical protein